MSAHNDSKAMAGPSKLSDGSSSDPITPPATDSKRKAVEAVDSALAKPTAKKFKVYTTAQRAKLYSKWMTGLERGLAKKALCEEDIEFCVMVKGGPITSDEFNRVFGIPEEPRQGSHETVGRSRLYSAKEISKAFNDTPVDASGFEVPVYDFVCSPRRQKFFRENVKCILTGLSATFDNEKGCLAINFEFDVWYEGYGDDHSDYESDE